MLDRRFFSPHAAAKLLVHGNSSVGRFNMRLATLITKLVGSMWCAYVFTIIALVSLPTVLSSGDPVLIVGWIAQTFLQLVLLSVIMVAQNVSSVAGDARAKATYDDATELLALQRSLEARLVARGVIGPVSD